MYKTTLVALAVITLSSCTWVKLQEGGALVRLASPEDVTACKRLGTTISTSKAKIGFMNRKDKKVESELLTLAQNHAAEMGGDTIVTKGPMEGGSQTFIVYNCNPEGA